MSKIGKGVVTLNGSNLNIYKGTYNFESFEMTFFKIIRLLLKHGPGQVFLVRVGFRGC